MDIKNMDEILINIKDILEKYRDDFTEEEKLASEEFDLLAEVLMNRDEKKGDE